MSVTIGLVGAVRRAPQVHAPTLTGTAGIGFAGVWSRFPWPVREIAERYGVPRLDRFSELLDPIVGVRAHGDRRGWLDLMLDHQVSRFS
jgi:predicted dehydrogenase